MNTIERADLIISQESLEYIYSIIGYPVITLEDTGVLTEQAIKDYVITPALRTYYKYYPIEEIEVVSVSTGGTMGYLDFPDRQVYGVFSVKQAQAQDTLLYPSTDFSSGIFFRSRSITKGGDGTYGSRYNYGQKSIQSTLRTAIDAQANMYNSLYWELDFRNRKLNYRVTNAGKLEIAWALWDANFDMVRYEHYEDIIKLCQGEMLLYWSRMLNKIDPEIPTAFDVDAIKDEGEELRDTVLEAWKTSTKPVLIRTTM